eukprot:2457008-Alexandrium_andersonii.AAC.1
MPGRSVGVSASGVTWPVSSSRTGGGNSTASQLARDSGPTTGAMRKSIMDGARGGGGESPSGPVPSPPKKRIQLLLEAILASQAGLEPASGCALHTHGIHPLPRHFEIGIG